ncbi:MAG: hypothetical protein WCJ17_01775 [bacterium]
MMKTLYGLVIVCSVLSVDATIGRLASTHVFSDPESISVAPFRAQKASAKKITTFDAPESPVKNFMLKPPAASVDWSKSISLVDDGDGYFSTHFVLHARDVIDATGGIGVVLYIAGAESREKGSYDFRIEIRQKRPDSVVTVYSADGALISGDVPMIQNQEEIKPKPYLPWLDGMKQSYSIVLCRQEAKPYFFIVQHTKEKIVDYSYQSPLVRTILEKYARHERLQNRRHGYLDQADHMRCLPIPLDHQVYQGIGREGMGFVAFAILEGDGVIESF